MGDHPQRVRHGCVRESVIATWADVGTNTGPTCSALAGLMPTVSTLLGGVLHLADPVLPLR